MKRRTFLSTVSLGAMALGVGSSAVLAQGTPPDLMAPGPLPEKSFGRDDAPVTVVEYASMTCGHCQRFHLETFPVIKKDYIDTGKVRFIFREFPFDPRSTAAFMLARCVGDDKWYPTVDLLFRTQEKWARAESGSDALRSSMAITGMSGKEFEACLGDQALLEKVNAVAEGGKKLGVDSTPTFFINGKMETGALTIAQFAEIVDPLVAAAGK